MKITKPGLEVMNGTKVSCSHCSKEVTLGNRKRHEESCYLNPKNLTECPVCSTPIKNYKTSKTCGYSCSNTYHRSGENNPNYKGTHYRDICFSHHGKSCIVCGEDKIVAVHHLNENHDDDRPENLVPMCPTHHQYMHSQYRNEMMPYVEKFLSE